MAATPVANSVPLTGNRFIDGLTQGSSWSLAADRTLTYSTWDYFQNPGWSTSGESVVRSTLDAWSNVANVRFGKIVPGGTWFNNSSEMSFLQTGNDLTTYGAQGLGVPPDPLVGNIFLNFLSDLFSSVLGTNVTVDRSIYPQPEGDVFIDHFSVFPYAFPGGAGFSLMLHEIGHALGLKHTFDDGYRGRPSFEELGISHLDNELFTVMSYQDYDPSLGPGLGHAVTPMPLDILAIQYIYGPNWSYHAGNDTYVLSDTGYLQTIWDAGGIDTFNASGLAFPVWINLNQFGYSFHGVGSAMAIAGGTVIENAIGGSAADLVIGNPADNLVVALSGDDTLDGGAGADTLDGGAGTDTATYASSSAGASVNLGAGTASGGDAAGDTLTLIENIIGSAFGDVLTGDSGANTLSGGGGNDILNGGTGTDTAVFTGNRIDYSISEIGSGVNVSDLQSGRDGTDFLGGIEQYQFSDGTFTLSGLIAPTVTENGVYRFFNTAIGTHFYSASAAERNWVIDNLESFNYENVAFKAAPPGASGTASVWRFFNTETGSHFYTISEAERDVVLETLPQFNFEGAAYESYTEQVDGSTGLHRFFRTDTGTHFYTASDFEKEHVEVTLPQYNYEGIAYYVDVV